MSGAVPVRSPLARATVLAPIALLVFVILYGGFGLGRDTTPKTHSLRNPAACAECHAPETPTERSAPEPALCVRCHGKRGPECDAGGAADAAGAAACTRCHDPHGKVDARFLLRGHG